MSKHPTIDETLAVIDRFRASVAACAVAPPMACVLVHLPSVPNGAALFEVYGNVDVDSLPVFLHDAAVAAAANTPPPLH